MLHIRPAEFSINQNSNKRLEEGSMHHSPKRAANNLESPKRSRIVSDRSRPSEYYNKSVSRPRQKPRYSQPNSLGFSIKNRVNLRKPHISPGPNGGITVNADMMHIIHDDNSSFRQ